MGLTPIALKKTIDLLKPDRILLVEDGGMAHKAQMLLSPIYEVVAPVDRLCILQAEYAKTLFTIEELTLWLNSRGATRSSLLLAAGGGALLDMAGFAASIYKRGMYTAYIPTTLMAMVDAAFGGKTAINVGAIKNLLGRFYEPEEVFVDSRFLATLPEQELLSGYWELVKYALLSGEELWARLKRLDPLQFDADYNAVIKQAIAQKQRFVEPDLYDHGVRQYLNLGHTIGHALEGFSRTHAGAGRRVLLHGEAVCIGLITELYISVGMLGFPDTWLRELIVLAREHFSPYLFECKEYPQLLELMRQDKKNRSGHISIIGLRRLGEPLKLEVSEQQIRRALDFYRETFG